VLCGLRWPSSPSGAWTPPVPGAAGAAADAALHIPQSLKKNFSLIALMHLHHCITCTTAPLHHLSLKKIFHKYTHTPLTPIPEHTDNPLSKKNFFKRRKRCHVLLRITG
jgi:hypothetical protein